MTTIDIIPPDELFDRIWNRLTGDLDTDDCSRKEATEAIDDVCLMLHESDPTRFPWDDVEEGETDDDT